MKKYFEGIKFGLILQFAIGPMCLMVFNTAKNYGFMHAIIMVLIIASVDAFYITLSCIGSSRLLKFKKYLKIYKIIGSIILMLLGLNIILNAFDISIIPLISINRTFKSIFIEGLVLALANPITIVFWTSVLTTKLIEDKMKKKDLIKFCLGLVSSTLLFMSSVAVIGTLISKFLSKELTTIINVLVGLYIVYFGIKMLFKKDLEKKTFKK